MRLVILLFILLIPVVLVCSCAGSVVIDTERSLPFTVRLNEVKFKNQLNSSDQDVVTPAVFSDRRKLTRDLARALEDAGVFTEVFIGDEDE